MMTVAYKCDRCGYLIERAIKTVVWQKDEYGQTVEREVDLCYVCSSKKKEKKNVTVRSWGVTNENIKILLRPKSAEKRK